ncbi:hypothetical protein FHT40_000509 [Mycolicibacterium sp. BK556]|nr:hypothetical protein [Mycolicibacterium sp. BK556]MBB3630630.1 hypothetical protein [Mycolicibacterium sp. BK607]MBB3748624.1 hypothetical protein [Mycolicibacterium sp. BK634]TDO10418.1 hypothetical protein EV580_4706 [Mycobacterium sp. BK086]
MDNRRPSRRGVVAATSAPRDAAECRCGTVADPLGNPGMSCGVRDRTARCGPPYSWLLATSQFWRAEMGRFRRGVAQWRCRCHRRHCRNMAAGKHRTTPSPGSRPTCRAGLAVDRTGTAARFGSVAANARATRLQFGGQPASGCDECRSSQSPGAGRGECRRLPREGPSPRASSRVHRGGAGVVPGYRLVASDAAVAVAGAYPYRIGCRCPSCANPWHVAGSAGNPGSSARGRACRRARDRRGVCAIEVDTPDKTHS